MYILMKSTLHGTECYPFRWDCDAVMPDADEIAYVLEVEPSNSGEECTILEVDDNELRHPPTLRLTVTRED